MGNPFKRAGKWVERAGKKVREEIKPVGRTILKAHGQVGRVAIPVVAGGASYFFGPAAGLGVAAIARPIQRYAVESGLRGDGLSGREVNQEARAVVNRTTKYALAAVGVGTIASVATGGSALTGSFSQLTAPTVPPPPTSAFVGPPTSIQAAEASAALGLPNVGPPTAYQVGAQGFLSSELAGGVPLATAQKTLEGSAFHAYYTNAASKGFLDSLTSLAPKATDLLQNGIPKTSGPDFYRNLTNPLEGIPDTLGGGYSGSAAEAAGDVGLPGGATLENAPGSGSGFLLLAGLAAVVLLGRRGK